MEKQTAGRDKLGKLATKFAELNDDVLFGEIWSREDKLNPRDRSMITIALVEYFLSHYNIDESRVYISGASGGGETLSLVLGKKPELFTSALFISSQWDGDLNVLANARTPLYIVIGENDSYYGSTRAINAYNSLHDIYENQGLSEEQINEILVLDVKEHEYFSSQGVSDEHAGLGLFAYDEDVMSWVFSKSK